LGKEKERHRIKERGDRRKELMESQSQVNAHIARRRVTTKPNAEK